MSNESPTKRVRFTDSVDEISLGVKEIGVEEDERYSDIYNYLKSRPKHCTFEDLPGENIKAIHRNALVEWLLEVTIETKRSDHTFQLAVVLLDKSLSLLTGLKLGALQIVGMACFLIASKLKCIKPISIEKLLYFSDNAYSADSLRKAEEKMLNLLGYDVCLPTIQEFVGFHLSTKVHSDKIWSDVRMLANKAICDYRYCKWTLDEVAEACANLVLEKEKEDECAEFIASVDK